ncbi:hypothetical protein SLS58_008991 [Diplodia intermedia]|uniref:Six-bladed beta-propeller-like protein n=1 Tax=Diplodia intermedia TaxID=856260 RepID=A0ABR3TEV5_9PEZI
MALLTRILSAIFLAACAANAAPTLQADSLRLIHQFPLGTWVENIAVRGNGNLLVTSTRPTASLHQLDPLTPHSNPSTTLIHTFANHTQLTAIAEPTPAVFTVLAFSTIYAVAFTPNASPSPTITPLATIPPAGTLNGPATLPAARTLLISDPTLGLIWRLDVRTGIHAAAVLRHNATMSPTTDLGLVLGVNGLRYHEPTARRARGV